MREPAVALLDDQQAAQLCCDLGIFGSRDTTEVRRMTGGVSGSVFQVQSKDFSVVVKQALPTLNVAAEWHMDPARSQTEASCLRFLAEILPAGSSPQVLFSLPTLNVVVMTSAPRGGVVWKDAIMQGKSHKGDAAIAGALLAQIHGLAQTRQAAAPQFSDRSFFIQGRIDPFHREVARIHPALAPAINEEVERMLSTSLTLVVADYTPKNLLSYPGWMMALDFEMAHWGDPSFDVASCLAHLIAKAHRSEGGATATGMGREFLDAYLAAPPTHDPDFLTHVAAEVGCVLLARVDGKSPLSYLDKSDRDRLRNIGQRILLNGSSSLLEVLG